MKTKTALSNSHILPSIIQLAILIMIGLTTACFLPFFDKDELAAPMLAVPTQSDRLDIIELQWSFVNGAEKYNVMVRDVTAGGVFADLGMFEGTSGSWPGWTVSGWITITPGYTYEFKVCAHRQSDGAGKYSQTKSYRVPDFTAPKGVLLTEVTNGVRVSWNAVETADCYKLQRFFSGQTSTSWADIVAYNYSGIFFVDTDTWPGVDYQYRVQACSNRWSPSVTDYSDPVQITRGGPGPGDQYVWENLGASDFGFSEGKPSLALVGNTLYLLYADAQDDDTNRLMTMAHNSGAVDSWYTMGDHISIGAPSGNQAWALAVDGTVYAAYGDLGDDEQLYVMNSTASDWSSVGLANGVAVFDAENTITWHKSGTYPSVVPYGSGLLMVYISNSASIAGSLFYPGSGDHWVEADSSYWISSSIGGFETALALDTAGIPVAALQNGGGTTAPLVKFYRYNSGSWGPDLGTFDPADGSNNLYLRGFLIDSINTPYLAYETFTYGDLPLVRNDIARWNGSSWVSLNLPAAIDAPEHIMDVAILEHPDGTGILAAAACSDGTDYWIGLWAYDGTAWQRTGPLLEGLAGVDSVAMVLDAEDRPVLVYTAGWTQALTAVRLSAP